MLNPESLRETCGISRESEARHRILARRARPADEVLSWKDLAELQHRLSMMSQTAVEDFYCTAHMVCRIGARAFSQTRGRSESWCRRGSR
jgi:hypothetical protein